MSNANGWRVIDHYCTGTMGVNYFPCPDQARELFQTAASHIRMGVLVGCVLVGPNGAVIDSVGKLPPNPQFAALQA